MFGHLFRFRLREFFCSSLEDGRWSGERRASWEIDDDKSERVSLTSRRCLTPTSLFAPGHKLVCSDGGQRRCRYPRPLREVGAVQRGPAAASRFSTPVSRASE